MHACRCGPSHYVRTAQNCADRSTRCAARALDPQTGAAPNAFDGFDGNCAGAQHEQGLPKAQGAPISATTCDGGDALHEHGKPEVYQSASGGGAMILDKYGAKDTLPIGALLPRH